MYKLVPKIAFTDLLAFMLTVTGLTTVTTSPIQPRKLQPLLALAVSVTIVLLEYDPAGGDTETEPPPGVELLRLYIGTTVMITGADWLRGTKSGSVVSARRTAGPVTLNGLL